MCKFIKIILLILCLCICGCGAKNEADISSSDFSTEDEESKEEERNQPEEYEELDFVFEFYDESSPEVIQQKEDLGTGENSVKVLTREEAKKALIDNGYLTVEWVDLQGNPLEWDNAMKTIEFVMHGNISGKSVYYIGFGYDGMTLTDIMEYDLESYGVSCWRLYAYGWDMYVPQEKWISMTSDKSIEHYYRTFDYYGEKDGFEESETIETDIENFEYRYYVGYDENGKVVTDGSAGYVITGLKNTSLTELYIPDSVVEIEDKCFWGKECDYITKIVVPDSVKIIGNSAFRHCDSLREVVLPAELEELGDNAFSSCSSLVSVKVPSGVKKLGTEVFWYCSSLKNVELPDGLQEIGLGAFESCVSLQSVKIPSSVTHIQGSAFSRCDNLTTVELPEELKLLGSSAFYGCTKLANIDIPKVENIYESTFYGCESLVNVEIPAGVKNIYGKAFGDCWGLLTIRIPATVTGISEHAFGYSDNFIIITEPGAYAASFAQENSYPYGEESGWGYDTDPELNTVVKASYEVGDFSQHRTYFYEDETWYINVRFGNDVKGEQTKATYEIYGLSSMLNPRKAYGDFGEAVKNGDEFSLEFDASVYEWLGQPSTVRISVNFDGVWIKEDISIYSKLE